jgi:uncharacterized protein (TIGR03643 family)
MAKPVPRLSAEEIERVIAIAWDDRPPYSTVMLRCGLSPGQLVALMKRELTPNAYKVWTARTRGAAPTSSTSASSSSPAAARPPSARRRSRT